MDWSEANNDSSFDTLLQLAVIVFHVKLEYTFFFGADPLEKSGHLTKLYLFLFERLFTGVASPREIQLIETLQQHAHACWSSDDVEFYHAPCRVVVRCSHQSDEMMVTVECWEI